MPIYASYCTLCREEHEAPSHELARVFVQKEAATFPGFPEVNDPNGYAGATLHGKTMREALAFPSRDYVEQHDLQMLRLSAIHAPQAAL